MNESPLSPELETLLDECLEAVLRGKTTLDECLMQYPEYAAELRPLLQVGLLTTRLKSPEMPAAGVEALEARLRGQMAVAMPRPAASRVRQGRFTPLAKLAAMVAVVLLLALGAGGGAVAASSSSIPGDPLYGLKRLWEQIVLLLSPLTGEIDDLWLRLAQTRLYEAEQLAGQGRLTDEALVDLYAAMAQSITLADEATTPQVVVYLEDARDTLADVTTAPEIEAIHAQVVELAQPELRVDGRLQPPEHMTLSPEARSVEVIASPTTTPTATATLSPSPEPTDTPDNQPSATFTPAAMDTATPRVPPTATRTLTPTVTQTTTLTPTMTPSATWTALPLPTRDVEGVPPTRDIRVSPDVQPTSTRILPTEDATIRYRETQRSVYMTQTAQPPPTATGDPEP